MIAVSHGIGIAGLRSFSSTVSASGIVTAKNVCQQAESTCGALVTCGFYTVEIKPTQKSPVAETAHSLPVRSAAHGAMCQASAGGAPVIHRSGGTGRCRRFRQRCVASGMQIGRWNLGPGQVVGSDLEAARHWW